jgi:quinol monooxygenase YgiN
MRETRTPFTFLLVAALLVTVAVPAWADTQQYVVVYGEFKPANTNAGSGVLEDLATQALASGAVRFNVLQQLDRPNFFALFEIWSSQQAYDAFLTSPDTRAIFVQFAALLQAPLDERDGNLIEGSVTPRDRHAAARQLFVITHVDIIPTFLDQAKPLLLQFVADSAGDPGVQTFAMLSWDDITNHFQLIEVFANQQAFDAHVSAQHTVIFRNSLQPFIGAPIDERLYQFGS